MRYELTETLSEILDTDIVERGVNAMLLCRFHDEDTPSFSVNLDTGLFQCFSCGVSGNIEKLARLLGEELSESTRQDILIRSLSQEPQQRSNFAPLANRYIEALGSRRGQQALADYLEPRRLPVSIADDFGLGYDEQRDSLSLPYWDGEIVTGIKYRSRRGDKYSESNSIYGLYNVDDLRGKPIVVIGEGESDSHQLFSVLSGQGFKNNNVRQPGLPEGVGVGGTSGAVKSDRLWKLFALDLLFARKVFICYDADSAGDEAFTLASRVLGDKVIRIKPTRGNDITEHMLAGGTLNELGLDEEALRV